MKKTIIFLAGFILLGFIFSSFTNSSRPKDFIIGKWKLKEIISTDSIPNPVDIMFNKLFIGTTYEYNKDGSMKMEFTEEQKRTATLKASPDKYYLVKENKKMFLVHAAKNEETKYEILMLNSTTLSYKSKDSIYKLERIN